MNARVIAIIAALLAGCSTVKTVTEADTVIGGRAYRDQAIDLGRVKMRLALQPQVKEDEKFVTDPEQIDIVIGFLTAGEPTSVVVAPGRLLSKRDGKLAELTARFQAHGSAQGCGTDAAGELSLDYWFNARADAATWKCATLRFRLPGHQPEDPLEMTFEPVNVAGELVRVLPVSFRFRTFQVGEEKAASAEPEECRLAFGMYPDTKDRRRQERERICAEAKAKAAAEASAPPAE